MLHPQKVNEWIQSRAKPDDNDDDDNDDDLELDSKQPASPDAGHLPRQNHSPFRFMHSWEMGCWLDCGKGGQSSESSQAESR